MINTMQTVEFARARTALKCGLQLLGVEAGSVVLVPDYLCNVVWHPLLQLGLQVKTYPVLDNLSPDWVALEKIQQPRRPAWALLMVHYFGQPQNVDDFRRFCSRHHLKLIDDAAHGHGGKHRGQLLGTLGDIGISSPRKTLNLSLGGCLYIDHDPVVLAKAVREVLPSAVENTADLLKSLIRRSATLHNWLKAVRSINRDWSDPFLFHESEQADCQITPAVSARIRSAQWEQIARRRRAAWQGWQEFCVANGLEPVFDAVGVESCPWALPVYAKDLADRNRWLVWGVKHGIPLFNWPALSTEVIDTNGMAFARWQRMLCFPLDTAPLKYKGLKFEN